MYVDGGARAEREPGRRGGGSKVRVYGSQDGGGGALCASAYPVGASGAAGRASGSCGESLMRWGPREKGKGLSAAACRRGSALLDGVCWEGCLHPCLPLVLVLLCGHGARRPPGHGSTPLSLNLFHVTCNRRQRDRVHRRRRQRVGGGPQLALPHALRPAAQRGAEPRDRLLRCAAPAAT
jgi:hypothetical protein